MHFNFPFIKVWSHVPYSCMCKWKYHKKWYSRICYYVKILKRINWFFFTIHSKHRNFSRNTIKAEITIIIKKPSWVFSQHNIIIFIIFVFLLPNLQLPYQLNIICWIIFNSLFFIILNDVCGSDHDDDRRWMMWRVLWLIDSK